MNEIFVREQLVRRPRAQVFEFFSRPENLARVTPPRLGFTILTPSPVPMREGSVIDYRIRVHGLPLRWRTLITAYDPPTRFVDEQARGPYALWHHTHEFLEVPEGTLVRDTVRYRLPLGPLGRLVAGRLVAADLEDIFRFRRKAVEQAFAEFAAQGGRTMNIVVAGATGFIGKALVDALIARGDRVTVLSRRPESAAALWGGKAAAKEWDGKNPGPWVQALDGADAVVNLAGEGVADARWSAERKLALTKSRIDSTRAIVAALKQAARRPKALLNASAVG
jgi:ligand-binding SRPBCC domain-containing protein